MKHLFVAIAVLLIGSTSALAQTAVPTTIEQQSPALNEMRASAGEMKDVVQALYEQLQTVNKLGTNELLSAERSMEMLNAIKTDIASAESTLTHMSTADNDTWAAMKPEVLATQEALSKNLDLRKQELKKAFGSK